MAVTIGDVVLLLSRDDSRLKTELGQTEADTKGWAERLGGSLKTALGTALLGGIAAIGAGIVGVGAAAIASAGTIDSAYDLIQTKTGATGQTLEELKADFEQVFANVPADAETVASVLGTLNSRLGVTGEFAAGLTEKLIRASDLMGGDATTNTELFTRVLGDWGVNVEDGSQLLDEFFVASQQTGAGMDTLMAQVVQFGAPLRNMGFTLQDSVALFAKWEQEGVNAELVMGSLRIATGKFAESGKPLRESLMETFDAIQNNKDATAALALGMDVFGARAGPDMVAAIREGRFSIEDLTLAMAGADGAILETAESTDDFGQKWEMASNRVTLALAPLGQAFLDIASGMIDRIMPAINLILPLFTSFATELVNFLAGVSDGSDLLSTFGDLVAAIFGPEAVKPALEWATPLIQFFENIQLGMNPLNALFALIQDVFGTETGNQIIGFVLAVRDALLSLGAWIAENKDAIIAGLTGAAAAIAAIAAGGAIAGLIGGVVAAIGLLVSPIGLVVAAAALLGVAWSQNWGGIQEKTAAVIGFILPLIQTALANIQQWWAENGAQVIATVTTLVTTAGLLISTFITFISGVISVGLAMLQQFWADHGTAIVATVTSLVTTAGILISGFITFISGVITVGLAMLQQFWADHGASIVSIVTSLATFVGVLISGLMTLIQTVITTVLTIVQTFWATWGTTITMVVQNMVDSIGVVIDTWAAIFEGDWKTVGENIRVLWETFKTNMLLIFSTLVASILKTFNDTDWGALGDSIIDGIGNAIRDGIGRLKDAAVAAAKAAWDAMMAFLEGGSPSELFAKVGDTIPWGLETGIKRSMGRAVDAMRNMGRKMLSGFIDPRGIGQMVLGNRTPGLRYYVDDPAAKLGKLLPPMMPPSPGPAGTGGHPGPDPVEFWPSPTDPYQGKVINFILNQTAKPEDLADSERSFEWLAAQYGESII